MNIYTEEYLKKMRVCANLLPPPADQVVCDLIDELSRLHSVIKNLERQVDDLENELVNREDAQ